MANDVTYTMYAALPIHLRPMVCVSVRLCVRIEELQQVSSTHVFDGDTLNLPYIYIYLVLFCEAAILPGVVVYVALPNPLFDLRSLIRTTTTNSTATISCS